MSRISRTLGVAGAVGVVMALGAPPAPAATTGKAYFNDSGSYMTGIFVGQIGNRPATCDATYSGSTAGSGSGSLNCNGAFVTGGSVAITCSMATQQVGPFLMANGTCTGTVDASGAITMLCRDTVVPDYYTWTCDVSIM